MKRQTGGSGCIVPAFVALVSVAGLFSGACGGIFGIGFTFDPKGPSLSGALLFLTACAVTIGAVMAIRWILLWKRTPAGETVNLRLLWIGLGLIVGGIAAMCVC